MAPATCIPVKELKNTAEFTQTVQNAKGPVYVTKNGREVFACISVDLLAVLAEAEARLRLYQEVEKGEEDIRAGRLYDANDISEGLKVKYGF